MPTNEFFIYLIGSAMCVLSWAYVAIQQYPVSANQALAVSSVVGFGPVILANILTSYNNYPVKMSITANMLHLFFGILFCSVPVTYGCWLVIVPKN